MLRGRAHQAPMPTSGRSLPQSPAHLSSLTSSSSRPYLSEAQSFASRKPIWGGDRPGDHRLEVRRRGRCVLYGQCEHVAGNARMDVMCAAERETGKMRLYQFCPSASKHAARDRNGELGKRERAGRDPIDLREQSQYFELLSGTAI